MNNFAKTINWFLRTNKKQYLKSIVGVTVGCFVLIAINTGMLQGYRNGVNHMIEENIVGQLGFVFIVLSLIPATLVCTDLKTKQQRTLYLMIPAKNSHKFWSRILISIVQAFIVFPLAIVVADLLQMLVSFIFTGDAVCVIKEFVHHITNNLKDNTNNNLVANMIALVASAAWGFTSYILGGFVFRRFPAIPTTIIWIIFWILIGVQGVALFNYFNSYYDYVEINLLFSKEMTASLILIVTGTTFTTLNLWLSYRIHKRMSIITHKWFNF